MGQQRSLIRLGSQSIVRLKIAVPKTWPVIGYLSEMNNVRTNFIALKDREDEQSAYDIYM